MDFVPWALFGLSLAANAGLGLAWLWLRKKPPPRRLDVTAQDLLHDLTRRGAAILKVEVVDPSGLMLRSPRS